MSSGSRPRKAISIASLRQARFRVASHSTRARPDQSNAPPASTAICAEHPYAHYAELPLTVPTFDEGDAYARERVRIAEVEAAFVLCQRALLLLEPGDIRAECVPPPLSEGLGWAESPRGALFYAVHVGADGRLARVKIKSPSFSNWKVFPFTVHDSNMMDYAINEASFGLTVAGCDR